MVLKSTMHVSSFPETKWNGLFFIAVKKQRWGGGEKTEGGEPKIQTDKILDKFKIMEEPKEMKVEEGQKQTIRVGETRENQQSQQKPCRAKKTARVRMKKLNRQHMRGKEQPGRHKST